MALVTYIEHGGNEHKVEIATGDSVMQGAVNNAIEGIVAECGGALACALGQMVAQYSIRKDTEPEAKQAIESSAVQLHKIDRILRDLDVVVVGNDEARVDQRIENSIDHDAAGTRGDQFSATCSTPTARWWRA